MDIRNVTLKQLDSFAHINTTDDRKTSIGIQSTYSDCILHKLTRNNV